VQEGEKALREQRGERRAEKERRQRNLNAAWGSDEED